MDGIATGLNTRDLIDKLIAVESQGLQRLETTRSVWQIRQKAWSDIGQKLGRFEQSASALESDAVWAEGDVEKLLGMVKSFVDAYNATLDTVSSHLQERRVINPKTATDRTRGALFSDAGLTRLASQLRKAMSDPADAPLAANIGISTGAPGATYSSETSSGRITLNEEKLRSALTSDPNGVRTVLTGSAVDPSIVGIAGRSGGVASQWLASGQIELSVAGASRQAERLQESIERAQNRLDKRRARYERIFTRLEASIGALQGKGNWLQSQIAQMNGA